MNQPAESVPPEVESPETESGPIPYALFLDYSENNVVVDGRSQGYRIRIQAKVKSGFNDANVFRYQKINDEEALFTGVCSPADIVDYSTNPSPRTASSGATSSTSSSRRRAKAYEIRDELIEELRVLSCECFNIGNNTAGPTVLEVSSDDR